MMLSAHERGASPDMARKGRATLKPWLTAGGFGIWVLAVTGVAWARGEVPMAIAHAVLGLAVAVAAFVGVRLAETRTLRIADDPPPPESWLFGGYGNGRTLPEGLKTAKVSKATGWAAAIIPALFVYPTTLAMLLGALGELGPAAVNIVMGVGVGLGLVAQLGYAITRHRLAAWSAGEGMVAGFVDLRGERGPRRLRYLLRYRVPAASRRTATQTLRRERTTSTDRVAEHLLRDRTREWKPSQADAHRLSDEGGNDAVLAHLATKSFEKAGFEIVSLQTAPVGTRKQDAASDR